MRAARLPAPAGLVLGLLIGLTANARTDAAVTLADDTGAAVTLPAPARRIVSLAPHITELLFAAGAGARVVGVVEYSNHPPQARRIASVGSSATLDLEAVAALKPDLVVGWKSGNSAAAIAKLRALGLPVFLTQPDRMPDVARSLEQIGRLAGTEAVADRAAADFRRRHAELAARYSQRPRVRVFYQIWKQPLMTINGRQIIADVLRLCGGDNVFEALPVLVPTVTVEAVLAADPEAIVASGMDAARPEWLDDWRRWPRLTAVARDNLFFVPPDIVQRHTPRLLDGAEQVCRHLETARAKRR